MRQIPSVAASRRSTPRSPRIHRSTSASGGKAIMLSHNARRLRNIRLLYHRALNILRAGVPILLSRQKINPTKLGHRANRTL
jgi:hypothetical protein